MTSTTPAASSPRASDRRALVLGATGGFGGEVGRQLRAAGWNVRALHRHPAAAAAAAATGDPGFDWIAGDCMQAADVEAAAQGAELIVHAVNPPGYARWSELVLPMIDSTLRAARRTGARVVLPGTVYNFGPDAYAVHGGAVPALREDAPQHPLTRKGAIRVELEDRMRRAAEDGVSSLIVRCGDFFGPRAGNSWFSQGLVRPGAPVRTIRNPALPGAGHHWAYLPDVARAVVRLVQERGEGGEGAATGGFERYHFAGYWDETGRGLAEAIQCVVERETGHAPRIAPFPWWVVPLAAPFVTVMREMLEMRYLWRDSVRIDHARLVATLGEEPATPLDEAVRATLVALGCLPRVSAEAPRAAPRSVRA
jgi:nucleoside-diphosphate-sugar epimerase